MALNGYDANSGAKISFLDSLGPVHPGGIKNLTKLQKLVRLCQYGVIGSLEHFFTWYGEKVACNPRTAIAACILATFLGGLGLIRFYEEGDAASLVIPRNSKFRNDIDWLDNNFPQEIRVHRIIYEADNVLTPTVIRAIYKQRKDLEKLTMQDKTFKDMCIKVPILKFPENLQLTDPTVTNKPNKEDEDWGFDDEFEKDGLPTISPNVSLGGLLNYFIPNKDLDLDMLQRYSNDFYPVPYCAVAQSTELACYEENIVELWGDSGSYNQESDALIESLTEEDILRTINTNNISNIFLKEKNFKEMLGGIKYNQNGEIIGAGAVLIKFYTSVNVSAVKLFGTASRGEKIDTVSYSFEGEMIKLLTNKTEFPAEMVSYVSVQRQFFESFVGQTFKDSDKLGMGYALVFIYVNFMLSKLNCVEQRVWLSCVGILSVAMGMILAYGVCSAFGWFYSAAHTVIPFLLLGIGIDNIFVITQAYDTLESSGVPLSLGKRFGKTMGHAGVAVSVTTFTDVFAFLVGSNTVLPGLESFCIYAAVSILAIYLMQVTHFLAWMSLDQQRMAAHRNGCCCCFVHSNFKPRDSTRKSRMNRVFLFIGNQLVKFLIKICVLVLTVLYLVGGIWGTLSLTQEYLPEWLLPPESEVSKWFVSKGEYFPSVGEPGVILISQINIPQEFERIDELVEKMKSRTENIDEINSWHSHFREYIETYKQGNTSFQDLIKDDAYFRKKLTQFLFSPKGAIYQANFWFAEKLVCGKPAPDILLQAIPFSHLRFERSSEWIPAMEEVEEIVESIPFSNYSFPIALTYINWKTDAIVGTELLRNVGIALICIFLTTLISLGSWRGSLLVMMCVLLTCIDVTGFMHWWGLTIDITSMNVIIISVGLCVDFCAHIVHGFLTGQGTREERVLYVMEKVAPAVMNGGFSTILALSLLVTSRSHIFISFFKIFLLICLFGLFHGLVTLPVVLACIGATEENSENKEEKGNDQTADVDEGFSELETNLQAKMGQNNPIIKIKQFRHGSEMNKNVRKDAADDVEIVPEEIVLLSTTGAAEVENPPNCENTSNNNQELEKLSLKNLECSNESAAEKSTKTFTLNKILRHSRNKSVMLKECPEQNTSNQNLESAGNV